MPNNPNPAVLLLVDDEPNILSALRRLFHAQGHRILTAGGGSEALAILEREPVDLVISDMRMPEMDGAHLLETVRARWPQVVRILLTGHADMASTIDAINRGEIYRYVSKPWDDEDLLLTVRDGLDRKRLEAENARLNELTRRQNEELRILNASLEQKVAERTAQLRTALDSLEKAHGDLKRNFLNSVRVFSGVVELRSGELGSHFVGHGRRVADMARAVARRMRLPDNEVQAVMLAGLLHDIGKLGLPDNLLDKPFNNLTGPQHALVMKHPVIGENLLMAIDQLKDSALAIRHHHECFDGSGYPDRLAGERIPLAARILAVVNDYDALQLGTLTKRRLAPAEALSFILDQADTRYDPAVVEAFAQWMAANQPAIIEHAQLPADEVKIKDAWQAAKPDATEVPVPMEELRPGKLQPGMVLAGDLIHRDGYLLLASGHTLDTHLIERLIMVEDFDEHPLTLSIRTDSIPAAAGTPG